MEVVGSWFKFLGAALEKLKDLKKPGLDGGVESEKKLATGTIVFAFVMNLVVALGALSITFITPLMILVQTAMLENGLSAAAFVTGLFWALLRFALGAAGFLPSLVQTMDFSKDTNRQKRVFEAVSITLPPMTLQFYNSHVSFYMAFRSPHYWASICAIIVINAIDVSAVLYNSYVFTKDKQKVGLDLIDIDEDCDGDVVGVEVLATVEEDIGWGSEVERGEQLPAFNQGSLSVKQSAIRASTLSTLSKNSGRSSTALIHASQIEATKRKVEDQITKAVSVTKAIQRKLNLRQLDIESRVQISRYVFVSKLCGLTSACLLLIAIDSVDFNDMLVTSTHSESRILFHSSVGYFNVADLLSR
ncbi:hypothetical protein HDU76_003923 [Blyttiomyces sp. JEL0837]|nr:hypothetical protein HDU76_003923 [Blyttiomyces sp. JEL0837]